jgi:acyl-CoA-binding protein
LRIRERSFYFFVSQQIFYAIVENTSRITAFSAAIKVKIHFKSMGCEFKSKKFELLEVHSNIKQSKEHFMEDLQQKFEQAQVSVKTLTERPDNASLLKLYVSYKQATEGDATGERPGMTDFVARAKFDAWKAIAGTTKEDAMAQYISIVDGLLAAA